MDPREGGGVYDTQKQNGSFVLKLLLRGTTGISAVIYRVIFEIIAHKSALLHAVWKMVQLYLIRVVVSDIVVVFCKGRIYML